MTPEQQMAQMDKNSDGKLTSDELETISEQFRSFMMRGDTNGDGALDLEELRAAAAAAARRAQGGGAGGPPGGGPPGGTP